MYHPRGGADISVAPIAGGIAQSVEQRPFKARVEGSSPSALTLGPVV